MTDWIQLTAGLVNDVVWGVPESIWGAITGSVLTLIGVSMTNRHNIKHQRLQFEFDSRERQRERQANLRRDVYLPAADAINAMLSTTVRMTNTDVADDDINNTARVFSAALTRVQLVSSPETMKHVGQFQRALLSEFSALFMGRFSMMLRRSDIELAASQRQGHHEERMRYIELMKEYNLAGTQDWDRWQTIERLTESASEGWAEAHGRWLRLVCAQETDRLTLTRDLLTRLSTLTRIQAPLLAAIRGELESGTDIALIIAETEKTSAEGMRAITDAIPVLEAQVANLRADVEAYEHRRKANPPILAG